MANTAKLLEQSLALANPENCSSKAEVASIKPAK